MPREGLRLWSGPPSVRRAQRACLAAVFIRAGGRRTETAYLAGLLDITPRSIRLASRLLEAHRDDLLVTVTRGRLSLAAAVSRVERDARAANARRAS